MEKVEIRAALTPGHHDALIEALGQHSRKSGNQMVFSISEACLSLWPVTLTDYTPPAHTGEQLVKVKMTLRSDHYPDLYKRYKSLGQGIRGIVFLNMLNRHMALSIGAPEEVMKAMTDYANGRRSVSDSSETASPLGKLSDSTPSRVEPNEPAADQVPMQQPAIVVPAEPMLVPDPMAGMDFGL
ncbi:TPA: hypothetical protein ACVGJS_006481 [Pseudomonas aeruginosa]